MSFADYALRFYYINRLQQNSQFMRVADTYLPFFMYYSHNATNIGKWCCKFGTAEPQQATSTQFGRLNRY